ncbi:MAG: YihY/virulence factor BrkB family protein [Cyanobacteria bacterium CRU_2_1]|nr:YihY/virulence factor BrkB family protein [Cyanobacteria bacterium RU_5_0]NJR57568.1 YihY/virulence factor BrkB family protein [Cyanobacteria bacterium CRU_2_1]
MLSLRFFRFFQHLTWQTIRKTIDAALQQRLPGLAAEMAYNTMLSLFPAILAVLTAIGLFNPLKATFQVLAERVSAVAPEDVLGVIEGFADAISGSQNGELFSLSFVFALWIASGALSAAMAALDQIHRIPRNRVRPFWKAKLIALGLTIGGILLLLLASAIVFISDMVVRHIAQQSGTLEPRLLHLWRLLALPFVLGIMSTLFAFIYRFGPSRWNPGQPIMPGAIIAAVFWAILSNLFRLYVQRFGNYNQVYGAVGAVIVLLIWLHMSSLIMLIGGQLNVTVGEAIQRSKGQRIPIRNPKSF